MGDNGAVSGFWKNRKKLPWYGFPPIVVGVAMLQFLRDWLAALGLSLPILAFGTLAGLFAAAWLVFRAGKWLSHRFPALESDREDIDFFGRS